MTFLLIIPTLVKAIYSPIPTEIFELNKTLPQEEMTMKGIVVDLSVDSNNLNSLENDNKKISNIAKAHKGKVAFTSKYGHSYIDVPVKKYKAIVAKLRARGYKVRDELILQPLLDESLIAIDAPYTWYSNGQELTLTGNNKIIAIFDTGIDDTHDDLQGKVLAWRDSIEIVDNGNYGSVTPYDDNGHGTFVSSIAAGTGEASSGQYTGVAPGANLLVARVCGPVYRYGYPRWECRERYLEDALGWIIDLFDSDTYRADVISMSLGTSNPDSSMCTDMSYGVNKQISNVLSRGIPVVASAGNDGPFNENAEGIIFQGTINWPACIQDVIAVGATYKKAYQDYSFGLDLQEALLVSAKVHVKIDWVDSDGLAHYDEYEWEALNASWSDFYEKTGFDKVISPGPYSENVWVRYEVMGRVMSCHWFWGCQIIEEIWYPWGGEEKGQAFWGRQCYVPWGYDGQMVVQFSAWPMVKKEQGQLGWEFYIVNFPLYEPEPGIFGRPKGININCYNNFNDWQPLTDFNAFWSSKGPPPQGGIMKPDVVAPGYLICAALATDTEIGEASCGNDQYTAAMGTSASTPFVSGLIALLKEANPDADINMIKNSVLNTADDVCGIEGYDGYWYDEYSCAGEGYGRINVRKAVDFITDCSLKVSYDIGDTGNDPLVGGSCYDYTSWAGDACTGIQYPDSCSGNNLNEYYATDNTCSEDWKNCEDYETNYCSGGGIYRNEWQCSGSPGYCNDGATDTLAQDCSNTCSDTDGGISYITKGTVTDKNLCSSGQTSCPSDIVKTDECLSRDVLREYYCSGNDYTYQNYDCKNLGADYTCSDGRCISSTATTNIYTNADAFVRNTNPANNYGSARISVKNQTFGGSIIIDNGWTKFDLSSLPSSIDITSAYVHMALYSTSLGSVVRVHFSSDDSWTESGITWNNQPSFGGIIDTEPIDVIDEDWDVTNVVEQEYNGNGIISLVFTHKRTDQSGSSFDSKEVQLRYEPYLEITYILPTTTSTTTTSSTTTITGGGGGGGGGARPLFATV